MVHLLARRNLQKGGGATRASTNADSYAWLANRKYFWDLTGYFPRPKNYKKDDIASASAQQRDGNRFRLNFGKITQDTSEADIKNRLNNILDGFKTSTGSCSGSDKPSRGK